MITFKIGDLFESKAQTLVNTVNLFGVMGKGIALKFKKLYPEMYKDYVARCKNREIELGKPYLFRVCKSEQDMFNNTQKCPKYILIFPTKRHWKSDSKLSDIIAGLEYLGKHYREWGITSLALPLLGCGHGQLEWRVIGPTLYRHLNCMDIPVEIYAPDGTNPEELENIFLSKSNLKSIDEHEHALKIKPSWVAMVKIASKIKQEYSQMSISHITFQRIFYFATEAGLPTGLHYTLGIYGPHSSEINHILTKLINNGILAKEYIKHKKTLTFKTGNTYQDALNAFSIKLNEWESIIDKTSQLFLKMQNDQIKIAAVVLFIANNIERTKHKNPSTSEIVQEVIQWAQKYRISIKKENVEKNIEDLKSFHWLNIE